MDRLESQGATLYTAPGLVPGLLGAVLLVLGVVLGFRAAIAGGHRLRALRWASTPATRTVMMRVGTFLALALIYAAGIVGRGGVPFWLATFVFVTASVLVFDWAQRREAGQTILRGVLFAAAIGAGTAFVVSVVFQQVFLVRLP
jgi:hypothetical protein